MISQLLDLVLHVDKHLQTFAQEHGVLIYVLLFAIIFCETGLIVTPFLPGDSLLFAVGALSAQGFVRIEYIIPLLIVAAIIGDNFNYWIGRKAGGWIVQQRWFRRDYLSKTEAFFVKHGGKAVVLARFVPIVRTFAPFTAGFGRMASGRVVC
jgi:membrane-associated protein